MPDLVLLSPCSGPVRRAAPAGVEAIVFSLAEGLRHTFDVHVVATPDSELPAGVVLHPSRHPGLPDVARELLSKWPTATFCDHSGAAIDVAGHPGFFRVFHVEPRYVFTPSAPERCGFVSAYLRGLFSKERDPRFGACPILYNGIDPGPAAGHAAPSLARTGVVYLGRVNRLKGLDLGVAACSSLGVPLHVHGGLGAEFGPDIVFNDLPLLDELAGLYPASFVYHGPLRDAGRKRDVLAGAAAVLISSREAESCSLVALEAVAAGAPAVTFRRGGVVEYLGDHPGVFFAEYSGHAGADASALAEALRRALGAGALEPSLPAPYTVDAMVARYRSWLRI